MKNRSLIAVVAIAGGLLSACDNPTIDKKHIRESAPLSQDDTGVFVSGIDKSQIEEVLYAYPETKVRVVNKKHNLYEIFNLELSQIQTLLPKAKAFKNVFFQYQMNNEGPIFNFHNPIIENNNITQLSDMAQPDNCINGSDLPTPKLKLVEPSESKKAGIIDLGQSFAVDASNSEPHLAHPSSLRIAWAVAPPRGSNQKQEVFFGNRLNFKPDALGLYSILALVQDDRNYCAYEMGGIVVTSNSPYQQLSSEVFESYTVDEKNKLSRFKHLAELQAEETWRVATGIGQLIAVIDSGVNYNHPALNSNIQLNNLEIPNNNIDDDDNGFIDDYVGYDFANSDAHPYDDQGHGSHVAGLAASPIFGIAKSAKVLAIKAMSPMGGDIASIIGAIYYAVDRGATVINTSFGNYGFPHPSLLDAVDYAESKGVVLVAAAGNGHPVFRIPVDTDLMPNYPSALPNDNIISVAAKSLDLPLAPYSNYGVNTVDVVTLGGSAPNDLMLSAFLENPAGIDYEGMSGTSMASPVVAGIVAQLLEVKPDASPALLKRVLMVSGEIRADLTDKVGSSRHLDGLAALQLTQKLNSPFMY